MSFVALASIVAIAACGASSTSSSSTTSSSAGAKQGGTITIASGTAPLSADQGLDFTTQGNELYSVVNTPLLTFVRGVEGTGGSKIIPALATSLPTLSTSGKTYPIHLPARLPHPHRPPDTP